MNRDKGGKVPTAALILGASGLVLPVVAIIGRLGAGSPPDTPLPAFLMLMAFFSASLMLAFLGGIWWGMAIGRPRDAGFGGLLVLAITPPILALLIAGLSGWMPKTSAVLLGLAIIATLPVDRYLARRGLAPGWWMRLRAPLSLALGLLVIGMGLTLI